MFDYTHIIAEAKSKFSPNLKPYTFTHEIVDTIEAFHQVSFNYLTVPPVKIKTKPVLFILKRKSNFKDMLKMRHFYDNGEEISESAEEHSNTMSSEIGFSEEDNLKYEEINNIPSKTVTEPIREEIEYDAELVVKKVPKDATLAVTTPKLEKDEEEREKKPEELTSKMFMKSKENDMKKELNTQINTEPKIYTKKMKLQSKDENEKSDKTSKDFLHEETDEIKQVLSGRNEEKIKSFELKDEEPKQYEDNIIKSVEKTGSSLIKNIDGDEKVTGEERLKSIRSVGNIVASDSDEIGVEPQDIPLNNLLKEKVIISPKKNNLVIKTKHRRKETLAETEESKENKKQVKQNIKKLIQKYRRKKFDNAEAKEDMKKADTENETKQIAEPENTSQKDEVKKIHQQIMEIIENNPNIANKDLIKEKLQKTIIDELLKVIDEKVAEKTGKLVSAKENVQTKKLVEVIEKSKSVQSEKINDVDTQSEKSAGGEDTYDAKIIKEDKIRMAQQKIEDVMNIIDDIVDTIEIQSNE